MEKSIVSGSSQRSMRSGRSSAGNASPANAGSQIANRRSSIQAGFSLLELMIAMFILIILISVALPTYQKSVQHARETVLKENLWQMRRSIDQYSSDKGKLPTSIDDLVSAKYLRDKPIDPITDKDEWNEVQGDDPNSSEGAQGLLEVKSLAEGDDSEGVPFSKY